MPVLCPLLDPLWSGLALGTAPHDAERDHGPGSGWPVPTSLLPPPREEAALGLMTDRLPLINVYVQRIHTSARRQLMRDISMRKSSVNTVINFGADSFLII